MSFNRDALPDAQTYLEQRGLKLIGPSRAKWKTTRCEFHDGSDSMRVNTQTGAFVCMAGCGAKGGDVLAYHMAADGLDFITAAKELGAWIDDGSKPQPQPQRPATLPPRAALEVLASEAVLVAVAAGNLAAGFALSDDDRARLRLAAGRIRILAGEYQA